MKPVHPGMTAHLSDGSTTTVIDVLIDTHTGEPRHLVLGTHGFFGPHAVAPYTAVWLVDDATHLALSPREAAALPRYDAATYGAAVGLCSRAAMRRGDYARRVARDLAQRAHPPGTRP